MNLFEPSAPMPEEDVSILYQKGSCRIERIVSHGHTTPKNAWYVQDEDEWLVLLEGSATLLIEGRGEIALKKGEPLLLRAHERHLVTLTSSPAIWLCVFYKEGSDNHA